MATSPTLRPSPASPGDAPAPALSRRRAPEDLHPTLFPVPNPAPLPPEPAPERVGIARLAASSPLAEQKRGTEYFLLPVRSMLNRCDSPRVPFAWTVNPYRGCEFGCRYCYARYTHEYMDLEASEFESKIYAKQGAGERTARELAEWVDPAEPLAIGTATDPYQPAEREFGVTRAILEQIAAREGLVVSITTKSNQVVRDLDLLRRIAARSTLTINLSITTLRARLARLLEPRAPTPDLRLATVRQLRRAGLAVGVFAMPVLPGITDGAADLDALARAARDAGAEWLAGQVLFLMPASQKVFLPFLEERFPRLVRQYRAWYARSSSAPESYRREISALFDRLRARYRLGSRPYAPEVLVEARSGTQLELALDGAVARQAGPAEGGAPRPHAASRRPAQALRFRTCA